MEQLTRRRGTSSKDGIIIDHRRQADSSHSTPSSRELAAMAGSVQAHHSIQIVETSGAYRITAVSTWQSERGQPRLHTPPTEDSSIHHHHTTLFGWSTGRTRRCSCDCHCVVAPRAHVAVRHGAALPRPAHQLVLFKPFGHSLFTRCSAHSITYHCSCGSALLPSLLSTPTSPPHLS